MNQWDGNESSVVHEEGGGGCTSWGLQQADNEKFEQLMIAQHGPSRSRGAQYLDSRSMSCIILLAS